MKKPNLNKESITIMIPAYNEEKRLAITVKGLSKILKDTFSDYEILIFDDCSLDRTGEIANGLAKQNPNIKVIHNKRNSGLGYNFRQGVKIAKKEYYCLIWADNDISFPLIKKTLKHIGEADFILTFMPDDTIRLFYRRIISRIFTKILNILFGLKIGYYCGIVVHKTALLKRIKMRTNGFAMQAEVIIQLIKKGYSYKEYPYHFPEREEVGDSAIFRLKNMIGVLVTITRLFFEMHFH